MNSSQGYRLRACSDQFGEVVWLGEKTRSEEGSNTGPFPVILFKSLFKLVLWIQAYKVCCFSAAAEAGLCSTGNSCWATRCLLPRATVAATWVELPKRCLCEGYVLSLLNRDPPGAPQPRQGVISGVTGTDKRVTTSGLERAIAAATPITGSTK